MIRGRRLHYQVVRDGDKLSACSTDTSRIRRPLVAIRAYVTCPDCLAVLGQRAKKPADPKPKVMSPGRKVASAAMKDALHALSVKPSPQSDKQPKAQLEGQVDIFDAVNGLGPDGQGDAYDNDKGTHA